MLILLSPAKSLDFESSVAVKDTTQPRFSEQAAQVMNSLRRKSAAQLSTLMNISDALAALNHDRNQQWQPDPSSTVTTPAVFAFQGDVYQGLAVQDFTAAQLKRCQKHVRLLSGLYGILNPLDEIQPYRLEMGTKLPVERKKTLYDFWGDTVRDAIAADLTQQKSDYVINLASQEYARVARLKSLDADIVTPDFRDWKKDKFKVISYFAKRARGLMARYIITNSVKKPDGLKGFNLDGYSYNEELSDAAKPVFTRRLPD